MHPKYFQYLTVLMVVLLVFEGLARKYYGGALNVLIFIAKDGLAAMGVLMVLQARLSAVGGFWAQKWMVLTLLFIPVATATLIRDPLLMVFGMKQYLIYPVMAIVAYEGFGRMGMEELRRWLLRFSYLVVPTTGIVLMQLQLPSSHWINLGVGGNSLEGFSAGGRLRLSSTFSFVAQYCMYLNFTTITMAALWFLRVRGRGGLQALVAPGIFVLFVIGVFATGSRAAVWGVGSVLLVAGLVFVQRYKLRSGFLGLPLGVAAFAALFLGREFAPDAFVAYDIRSAGREDRSHAEEVFGRVANSVFGWVKGHEKAPPTALGYGLGVMSNGSERLSGYARDWRAAGFWTEADLPTTMFEGGYYLVFIWMAARIWMVWFCYRLALAIRDPRLFGVACVATGYITVTGLLGTLGIQPPMAIWFWTSVGLLCAIYAIDKRQQEEADPLDGSA